MLRRISKVPPLDWRLPLWVEPLVVPFLILVPVIVPVLLAGCGSSEGRASLSEGTDGAPALSASRQEPLPPAGSAWVIFGADTVLAEVARTPEERERGLMYREGLEDGKGMLFVFPDLQVRSFWMRNTFIPLDVAYMDENLRIVDIQAMSPESDETHPSAEPAMFALEVPMGWFEKTGVKVGAQAKVVFGPG